MTAVAEPEPDGDVRGGRSGRVRTVSVDATGGALQGRPAQPHGRVVANGVDVAYLEAGDGDAPLALCLHGFPDCAPTFELLLGRLADAGWHAVAPWMRGYHPTGLAPDGRYHSSVLALDALALADALAPGDAPVVLVGHDWGAQAAVGAALLRPDRVARVVSLALPHPAVLAARLLGDWEQRKRFWYAWFFQLEGLAEMVVRADLAAFVGRLWEEWSPGFRPDPQHMADVVASLLPAGALEAALEYYRQTLDLRRQDADVADLQQRTTTSRLRVPALFATGAEDGCVVASCLAESAGFCDAECRIEVVEGCGHFLHLEKPEAVGELVAAFLAPELGTPSARRTGGGEERGGG